MRNVLKKHNQQGIQLESLGMRKENNDVERGKLLYIYEWILIEQLIQLIWPSPFSQRRADITVSIVWVSNTRIDPDMLRYRTLVSILTIPPPQGDLRISRVASGCHTTRTKNSYHLKNPVGKKDGDGEKRQWNEGSASKRSAEFSSTSTSTAAVFAEAGAVIASRAVVSLNRRGRVT